MPLDGLPQAYKVECEADGGKRTLVVTTSHYKSTTPLNGKDEAGAHRALLTALDSAQLHHGKQELLGSALRALQALAAELPAFMDRMPGTEDALPSADQVLAQRHAMVEVLDRVRAQVVASLGEHFDPNRTATDYDKVQRSLRPEPTHAEATPAVPVEDGAAVAGEMVSM